MSRFKNEFQTFSMQNSKLSYKNSEHKNIVFLKKKIKCFKNFVNLEINTPKNVSVVFYIKYYYPTKSNFY